MIKESIIPKDSEIYFSNELFALVQKVKVYNTYLIGTNSYETHNEDVNHKTNNKFFLIFIFIIQKL